MRSVQRSYREVRQVGDGTEVPVRHDPPKSDDCTGKRQESTPYCDLYLQKIRGSPIEIPYTQLRCCDLPQHPGPIRSNLEKRKRQSSSPGFWANIGNRDNCAVLSIAIGSVWAALISPGFRLRGQRRCCRKSRRLLSLRSQPGPADPLEVSPGSRLSNWSRDANESDTSNELTRQVRPTSSMT